MQDDNAPIGSVIGVVGASGHTGAFVVAELLRRGATPIAIGRDADRLAARAFDSSRVRTHVTSLDDRDELDRALDGTAAVINCAGPFPDTAAPVSAAAMRVGAHYLDITAEQASARAIFDRHEDARQAGIALVPAMAFYGGLVDLLCSSVATGWPHIDEVQVSIALDRWHPTAGTRETGRRNTVPRVVIEDGQLMPQAQPPARTTLPFPAPFGDQEVTEVPFSEVPLLARHLPIGRLRTWLAETALQDLRDPSTPPPAAVDALGRSAQRFLVQVQVSGSEGRRRATAQGQDIYAVTAPLVVEAAERLVHRHHDRCGAFAPGEIFDAEDFLSSFTPTVLDIDT